jgi:hypothetical protein
MAGRFIQSYMWREFIELFRLTQPAMESAPLLPARHQAELIQRLPAFEAMGTHQRAEPHHDAAL